MTNLVMKCSLGFLQLVSKDLDCWHKGTNTRNLRSACVSSWCRAMGVDKWQGTCCIFDVLIGQNSQKDVYLNHASMGQYHQSANDDGKLSRVILASQTLAIILGYHQNITNWFIIKYTVTCELLLQKFIFFIQRFTWVQVSRFLWTSRSPDFPDFDMSTFCKELHYQCKGKMLRLFCFGNIEKSAYYGT